MSSMRAVDFVSFVYCFVLGDLSHVDRKRCPTSLIITAMQIKITMRYHLTLFKIVVIKKTTSNKCWQECGGKGTLVHYWWDCKLV